MSDLAKADSAEIKDQPQPITCTTCKLTSTLPDLFNKGRCPRCTSEASNRLVKALYLVSAFLIFVDLLVNGFQFDIANRTSQQLLVYFLLTNVVILLHELSHALAAWALGGTVFGIHLGSGTQLAKKWFKKRFISFGAIPSGGFCYAGFDKSAFSRLRYAIFISAGMLFHTVMLLIFLPRFGSFETMTQNIFALIIIVANGVMLVSSLIPRRAALAGRMVSTDGKQLLDLIRGKTNDDAYIEGYYFWAGWHAFTRNDIASASEHTSLGMSLFPDSELLNNIHFLLLLEKDQLAEARELVLSRLQSDGIVNNPTNPMKAILSNNYAWTELLHQPTEDSLTIAHDHAAQAYEMVPWDSSITGTLGATKTMLGQWEEGAKLAQTALDAIVRAKADFWQFRAGSQYATLALAHFKMGNFEASESYFSQSKVLEPDGVWGRLVSAEIKNSPLTRP